MTLSRIPLEGAVVAAAAFIVVVVSPACSRPRLDRYDEYFENGETPA